jgi:tetratricopeptide (TPR) repeat protein
MDTDNPIVKLCAAGSRAEYEGRPAEARTLYQQAWDTARDDYEACIAAHYLARMQANPEQALRWNQVALAHAEAVPDERVQNFYPSLYVNLGYAYEILGNQVESDRFYQKAAALGLVHQAHFSPDQSPLKSVSE